MCRSIAIFDDTDKPSNLFLDPFCNRDFYHKIAPFYKLYDGSFNGNLTPIAGTFQKSASCPTTFQEPTIYKIGRIAFFNVVFNNVLTQNTVYNIGTIPQGFRPLLQRVACAGGCTHPATGVVNGYGAIQIKNTGEVEITISAQNVFADFAISYICES